MTKIIIDTQIDLDKELSEIYIKCNLEEKDNLIRKLREKIRKTTRVQLK